MLSDMPGAYKKRAFFTRWLKTALKPSWGLSETVAGVIGVVGGAIGHFIPTIGAVVASLGWAIALGALVAIVLYRLFMAPYWMAKEDQERIAVLEAEGAVRNNAEQRRQALAALANRATELFSRKVENDQQFEKFNSDLNSWFNEARMTVAAVISPGSAELFSVAPQGNAMAWEGSFSRKHNSMRSAVAAYRQRLLDLAQ